MTKSKMSWLATVVAVSLMAACGGGGGDDAGGGGSSESAPAQCSYSDAGDGTPLEGAPGTRLTDSRGSSYDIGDDCTLEFVECQYTSADGQLLSGQPADTFVDSDGTPKMFAPDCRPGIDPSALTLPQDLIDACAEVGGSFTAPDDTVTLDLREDWWKCGNVLLGDTKDAYDGISEQLRPMCVAPAEFTSGVTSAAAPWYAGWSCSPAGTSSSIEVACTASGGTIDANNGPDDWTCSHVLIGETDKDQFAQFDEFMVQYCAAPAELVGGLETATAPWYATWNCRPGDGASTTGSDTAGITAACDAVGGSLLAASADEWSCSDVLLGDTTDGVADIEAVLAPYCVAPAQPFNGLTSTEPPLVAAWSCVPG